jgi:hypothetical protein
MRQPQITTNERRVQTPLLDFLQLQTLNNPPVKAEPTITVRCEICSENDQATRTKLDATGWGLYDSFEFCPIHESMI